MNQYIKKIQAKSEDTRKSILALSLVACMSFVVFIWVYGISSSISDGSAAVAQTNADVKPFSMLANSVGSTYDKISASVGNISAMNQKPPTTPQKQIDLIPVEPQAQ